VNCVQSQESNVTLYTVWFDYQFSNWLCTGMMELAESEFSFVINFVQFPHVISTLFAS